MKVKCIFTLPCDIVDLCPLLVGGDVCKVADHDDRLLLAVHGRLEVVGGRLILAVSFRLQDNFTVVFSSS